MLECGTKTCYPKCLVPNCTNAIIVGLANYNQYECSGDLSPIYPRVLNTSDVTDRETKIAAFFTDIRIHLKWIKQMITKNGGMHGS